MKAPFSENKVLKAKLRQAYRSRERRSATDEWRENVMTRIRRIGPLAPAFGFWPTFERAVWRLAPVNLILILILLLLNLSLGTGYDYLGNLVAELDRPSLSEFFGVEGT
jgi:hypothetical protein